MRVNNWGKIQGSISLCRKCTDKFEKIPVNCPPGNLYPSPPLNIEIVFVGVAPPRKGDQFYTAPKDGLRRGLFNVLTENGIPCHTINDFHKHRFFFSHTAKCAIRDTPYPNINVSRFCSSNHLRTEMEYLLPKGLCFLGKTVGYRVCKDIAKANGFVGELRFGEICTIILSGREVFTLSTGWPGRTGLKHLRAHLPVLLKKLKLV